MADVKISELPEATGIDPVADYLPIVNDALDETQRINRNTLLNITSNPVGISDVQNITNKTLDNTNTITVKDTLFTLQDNLDTTKQLLFQLSGITTATTRTLTIPNASTTIVGTDTAQTLTNKTITAPTITGGTISNSTISVDSIAEFTVANGVTVDGLNIRDGKLNTNNSVVTANITDSAVTPAKLLTGTGTSWAWQSWTPTFTNLSGGAITSAKYIQIGKTVFFELLYTLAGAGVAGNVTFTLPVTASSAYTQSSIGSTTLDDTGNNSYMGQVSMASTTTAFIYVNNTNSTYLGVSALSSTVPFTWGSTDRIAAAGWYEAA